MFGSQQVFVKVRRRSGAQHQYYSHFVYRILLAAVMPEQESEYTFYVTTDATSRASLHISGQEIFNDLHGTQLGTENNGGAVNTSINVAGRRGSVWLSAGDPAPLKLVYTVSGDWNAFPPKINSNRSGMLSMEDYDLRRREREGEYVLIATFSSVTRVSHRLRTVTPCDTSDIEK